MSTFPHSRYLSAALLLAATVLLAPRPARAQAPPALPAGPTAPAGTGSLTGTVLDSLAGKPVPYATVVLLPPAGAGAEKAVTGVAADDNGRFSIGKLVAGAYRLRVSYVGYASRTQAVTVGAAGATDVGSVRLPAAATALAEAVVVGQRPVVEVRPDRLIYNAEQDVSNAGGTAADVLRKAPLLAVDGEGNVKMRGSSNFKVLVNNKPSPTLANNLADALKSIPADQIKSIEVITTPPAKYDGEGTAGIINIVLKKGADRGLNGRVGASTGNRNTSLNSSLNFKKGKVGLSSSASVGRWYGPWEIIRERTDLFVRRPDGGPAQLSQRGTGRFGGGWYYGTVGLDFDPAENHSFSLAASVNGYGGSQQQDLRNRYDAGEPGPGGRDQLFVRDTKSLFSGFNGELTGTYTRTFAGKPRREWTVLGQAANNSGTFGYNFDQYNGVSAQPVEQASYRERSRGRTPGSEFTLQTDFTQPLSEKQTLELGLKSIWRNTGSIAEVTGTRRGTGFERLPGRDTDFDYGQNVQAAYATYSFSPAKKWNLSLGARAEHTGLNANVRTTATEFSQNYLTLLPNGNAQYAYSEKTSLRLAYSKRITRPFIDYLNPFLDRSDSLNLSLGNPRLNPELTDSYELSYNTLLKETSLSVSGSVRRTGNAIEGVRLPAAEAGLPAEGGVTVQTYRNVAANTFYQLSVYTSAKPTKGWDISGGPNLQYITRRSPALGIVRQGFQAGGNLNTSYKLPRDFTAQAFVSFDLPGPELQGRGATNLYYNFGLKKLVLDKKADLTLTVTNPFNDYWPYRSTLDTPFFQERSEYRAFQRTFRLAFSYRFGQAQQGKQRKAIQNDDVKGGGSKQGGQ